MAAVSWLSCRQRLAPRDRAPKAVQRVNNAAAPLWLGHAGRGTECVGLHHTRQRKTRFQQRELVPK